MSVDSMSHKTIKTYKLFQSHLKKLTFAQGDVVVWEDEMTGRELDPPGGITVEVWFISGDAASAMIVLSACLLVSTEWQVGSIVSTHLPLLVHNIYK